MKHKVILSEEELIHGFRQGDRQAFEKIYHCYASALTGFASKKLSSLEEARDVIQDVFVELWLRREKITITTSLQAYLFAAVRYKVIDCIRKNMQQDYYAGVVRSLSTETTDVIGNEIRYKELNRIIESEITRLPPRTRHIFHLSRKQHMSIKEIAREMNLSDQTVKNQLTTALKRLRLSLEKITALTLFLFL